MESYADCFVLLYLFVSFFFIRIKFLKFTNVAIDIKIVDLKFVPIKDVEVISVVNAGVLSTFSEYVEFFLCGFTWVTVYISFAVGGYIASVVSEHPL